MNTKLVLIAAFCGAAILSTSSYAHHGVNGQFDRSKSLTKKGIVTKVKLVNPHSYVYFDVTEDDGKKVNWRCELRSGSLLRRKGWTNAMFKKGTEIEIEGSPAHDEPTTCYTENITFKDGSTLTRYGEVAKDGSFINPKRKEGGRKGPPPGGEKGGRKGPPPEGERGKRGREDRKAVPLPEFTPGTSKDLSGEWGEPVADGAPVSYGVPRPPRYVVTQAATDVAQNWKREQNPRFNCMPTNIIFDYRFDQMVNKIEQSDSEIKLTYGFMDVVRTIHIDGKFPEKIEPSLTGYSVGTWDGVKLNVLTKGFAKGFLDFTRGHNDTVPNSEQMEIAETFFIDTEGELIRYYTVTDPVYLAEPHSHMNKSVKADGQYQPFDCDDLTVEEGR